MSRRTLPHSFEAEASVLGGILLRNEVLAEVGDLPAEAFYASRHQLVFQLMYELADNGEPIDVVTLEARLRKRERLDAIGGISFLSALALRVPTADNVRHYADIVLEKHAARKLMLAASEIAERGYGDYGDIAEFQAEAIAAVGDAVTVNARSGPRPVRELTRELCSELDRRYSFKDGITGVATGYTELDRRTAGLHPGELVVMAGRPAMGKTALAGCIAKNCAERNLPVLVLSLEMPALQLIERMLCIDARVSTTALRTGDIRRQDKTNIGSSLPHLAELPLSIDETPALSLPEVRARARRFAAEHGAGRDKRGLVAVDYLQLMRGASRSRGQNREQEIAEISRGLKALAKELRWPVLALSQLNRNLESRSNKRPLLSDLRESGAIEQDADLVLFLYRDAVYDADTKQPDKAELIIGKNRHGPTGTVELRYEAPYTHFTDPSRSKQ